MGSSPLARGLPPAMTGTSISTGIIPARAGFTRSGLLQEPCGSDHPRSRGVYLSCGRRRRPGLGSSPLARGLPLPAERNVPRNGIIPARAGFTCSWRAERCRREDHPRSRGVYQGGGGHEGEGGGSSPLARGLRARDPFSHWEIGIIPARAGFTRPHRPGDHPRRDHPRSRGVYLAWRSMTVTGSGSSPLARGLRFLEALEFLIVRIIPARAGFTHSAVKSALWWSGSSPLARGLRR